MVSLEKTIMREWQNLQTVFRSENARVQFQGLQHAICMFRTGIFVVRWNVFIFLVLLMNPFIWFDVERYEPSKKKCTNNVKNEEQVPKVK